LKLYEIGTKIREFRKEVGLTQEELAKKADITRVTLGKLERGEVGNVSVKTLDVILSSLDQEIEFKPKVKGFGIPTLDELTERF
jgi:transcriptional regulator with XRE-family HTH domain